MRKKGYPISIAIVLASLSFTMPAMAQRVPGFSDNVSVDQMQTSFERQRSEEEWAKLRDNVISWEEIGDLVHEYNPTVSSLWRNFRESDSKGSYNVNVEDARNQVEEAYEKALSAADGNSVAEALAEMQYQSNSSNFSADTIAQNADREIARLSVEQTELNTVETIKKSFISRESTSLQKQIDALALADAKTAQESTERKKAIGKATQIDVLTAKEAYDQANLSLTKNNSAFDKMTELLRVNLGWKASDTPEMPIIPGLSAEELAAVNLEEDSKIALQNNYSLRILERKLNLSTGDANRQNLTRSISTAKEKIQSDMLSKYQSLKQAEEAKRQAELQASNAQQAYQKAERGYKLGSVSRVDFEKAKNAADTASLQKQQAELKLYEEYLDYQAGKNGLATTD